MSEKAFNFKKNQIVNPIAKKIIEVAKEKRIVAYSDTRYSDGKHTDWSQKK